MNQIFYREMSVYIIAQINIHDRETYNRYEAGFDEVFMRHKGFVTSVDEDPVVLEGEWPFTRTVLLTFRSEEQARAWFESPEYQQLAEIRRAASTANIIMVKR